MEPEAYPEHYGPSAKSFEQRLDEYVGQRSLGALARPADPAPLPALGADKEAGA
ncbi:hypothetical protein [Streptomyces sp. 147326]|uniref:hypothetical protein n=1 Tax=Streptomyces sp. 147326 TaxID=3074379 RepID=UPI003857CD19